MLSITDLPPDILRYLITQSLGIHDLPTVCRLSKHFHRLIYQDNIIWWSLIERYLTRNPERLQQFHQTTEPRGLLQEVLKSDNQFIRPVIVSKCGFEVFIEAHPQEPWEDFIVYVCHSGHADIYKLVTERLPKYDHSKNIVSSVRSKKLELIRYIVKMSKRISSDDLQKALLRACESRDNFEIIDYILSLGANVTDYTIGVALCNSLDNVRHLLSKSNLSIKLSRDILQTILATHLTIYTREEIFDFLIAMMGFRPLDYPDHLDFISVNSIDIVPYMIEKGSQVKGCRRILQTAIYSLNASVVELLLVSGITVTEEDIRVALKQGGGLDTMKLLISCGVDLSPLTYIEVANADSDIEKYVSTVLIERGLFDVDRYNAVKLSQQRIRTGMSPYPRNNQVNGFVVEEA